jgi:hypothetical protein
VASIAGSAGDSRRVVTTLRDTGPAGL